VVYKIDRPTRSLTDFAKLVEIFDQQSVSFVSITQSFNTTTSMGRLTLNVLLSFAQFEREVIGERVRDKISASKKKGIWVVVFDFFEEIVKRHERLSPLNLIVWTKTNAGMGSLYRSQHELLPLYRKGDRPHVNNIALGKNGPWRSNVWNYPGASSTGSQARSVSDHPKVKPTTMLQDGLLDVTHRGDIVIDPFLGSGSTLIAAQRSERRCRAIELDPLYVDVTIRRFEATTGQSAVMHETGESFTAIEARHHKETA
jgi:DNA modification methylase